MAIVPLKDYDYGYRTTQGRSRCASSPRRFDANRPQAVLGHSVKYERISLVYIQASILIILSIIAA